MNILNYIGVTVMCFVLQYSTNAQQQRPTLHTVTARIQSGPMVGSVTMREAQLWVQTTAEARVWFVYADSTRPGRQFRTNTVQTSAINGYIARCQADSIEPGKTYMYSVVLNNQLQQRPYPQRFTSPPLWQWRTEPPAFRIALGSCTFVGEEQYDRPGKPYGGDYAIFSSIAATQPTMMLWLGDNVYLREADWDSRNGIIARYTHTRSLAELQPLLASCANYAIWDDHDYGPNDSDRGFYQKDATRQAFRDFWANPPSGIGHLGGITSKCSYGDVDIFLLDNRWFRSPNNRKTGERVYLGKEQLQWLVDNLVSSTASFKLICIGGQVLNSEAIFENYATYKQEREELLSTLAKEGVSGVVFLTGDRHHTELSQLERDGVTFSDLTVSPLTSGANPRAVSEKNTNRVEGTFVGERNFATIDVRGERKQRELLITVYSSLGKQLWQKTVQATSNSTSPKK